MHDDIAYLINTSKTISETLDGETIIINLENGNYYSVNPTASILWDMLSTGRSRADILRSFIARYDASADTIEKSVLDCLDFLKHDGLILETTPPSPTSSPESPLSLMKESFLPLKVDRYDDMQEMLLADPIHDVDQTGWPNMKPELKK